MTKENTLVNGSFVDRHGETYAQPTLTASDDQRAKIVLAKPSIIPVLFIPGIMGTNLKKKAATAKRGARPIWICAVQPMRWGNCSITCLKAPKEGRQN